MSPHTIRHLPLPYSQPTALEEKLREEAASLQVRQGGPTPTPATAPIAPSAHRTHSPFCTPRSRPHPRRHLHPSNVHA